MVPDIRQKLIEAVARAWTHPQNARKVMDPDLAQAVVDEMEDLFGWMAATAAGHPAPPRETGNSETDKARRAKEDAEVAALAGRLMWVVRDGDGCRTANLILERGIVELVARRALNGWELFLYTPGASRRKPVGSGGPDDDPTPACAEAASRFLGYQNPTGAPS